MSLFLYTVSVIRETKIQSTHKKEKKKKYTYQRLLSFTSHRSIQLLLVKLFLCVWDMGSFDIQSFSDMHTVRPKLIDVAFLSFSLPPPLCFNTSLSIFFLLFLFTTINERNVSFYKRGDINIVFSFKDFTNG